MGVLSKFFGAGWSSPVAHQAHNLKVAGSNPAPATIESERPDLPGSSVRIFFVSDAEVRPGAFFA